MYDSRSWHAFCDTMDAIRREQAKLKKRNEELERAMRAEIRKRLAKRVEEAA